MDSDNSTPQEQLEQEISKIEIDARARGFAVSKETVYQTRNTVIVAHAFFIPDQNGKLHHYDLEVRKWQRKYVKDDFSLVLNAEYDSEAEMSRALAIKEGSGAAVEKLQLFLNSCAKALGQTVETKTIIINAPENVEIDVDSIVKQASPSQLASLNVETKIAMLKSYRQFLLDNLHQNEKFIQDWLDEEDGKYKKQRCLIFGLEFINHKREGELSRKRFDILTTMNNLNREYVLMELKSPNADVFKVVETENGNEGKSTEYHLSDSLARSIPQILHYKRLFQNKSDGDDDLQRIGVTGGKVCKCIIIIGTRKDDPVWKEHFYALIESLGGNLEIWTYTYLIEKLEATIANLEAE
jgi:hypothetical protein